MKDIKTVLQLKMALHWICVWYLHGNWNNIAIFVTIKVVAIVCLVLDYKGIILLEYLFLLTILASFVKSCKTQLIYFIFKCTIESLKELLRQNKYGIAYLTFLIFLYRIYSTFKHMTYIWNRVMIKMLTPLNLC